MASLKMGRRTCSELGVRTALLGLIETQALLLERQPAVIEEPANLRLGILDHRLIEYAMHATRQHRIDMRHQLHVVAIVSAEIAEIVGEVLAAGKVLLESPRSSSRADDAGRR